MKISIVIPTYRRPDLLRRILGSIEDAERPASLAEIVVVENGGQAGAQDVCVEMASRLPLSYVYEESAGLSNARNVGARHCTGEVLLFFDDDIRVCAKTLTAYDAAFRQHGATAFYGGPLVPDYEEEPPEWVINFLPPSARGFSLGSTQIIIPEICLLGGNLAVPRAAFEQIGGFDPISATGVEGGGTGEEKRLQARLMEEGLTGLYIPDALVGHFVPANRCDPPFIRRRRWRRGYGFGQLHARSGDAHRTLLGTPHWWWSSTLGKTLQYAYSILTRKTRGERFGHLLLMVEAMGWRKGFVQERKQSRNSSGPRP